MAISLTAFDRWHGSPVALDELSDAIANRFILYQLDKRAPRTVKKQRADILAVWRYAANEHKLCRPPLRVRPVPVPQSTPDAWSLATVRKMLDAAKKLTGELPCGIALADWWELFIRTAYDTALRLGDLLTLPIDVAEMPTFSVLQSKTQQPIIKRLSPATRKVAARTLHVRREMLLPWPYRRETLWVHWRKHIIVPAGLAYDRRQGPQKMRRTSASHVERDQPGAASQHLGHLTPGLAEKHYIDPRIARPEVPLPPELDKDQ